jgi:hypothetical protein
MGSKLGHFGDIHIWFTPHAMWTVLDARSRLGNLAVVVLATLLVTTLSSCSRMAERESKYGKNEKCVIVRNAWKNIVKREIKMIVDILVAKEGRVPINDR